MDTLAQVCESIASHSSRNRKVALLSDYLKGLDTADFERAVHFLSSGPMYTSTEPATLFGTEEKRPISVGGATLREALIAATGWDVETVRLCARETGDTGETISLLIRDFTLNQPMTLAHAEDLYGKLARSRQPAEKVEILKQAFRTYRPPAIKYFVKIIGGNLRIGLQSKMVEEAVAASTGASIDDLRAANNRMGNLSAVALAARIGELHRIEAALFHPMEFMLAKPLDRASELAHPSEWIVEDKFDGVRCQAHYAPGRVTIYTRGMEDVTHAFPEVETALGGMPGSAVLDGELLGWRDGRAAAFTLLQQRLARKRVSAQMMKAVPVVFIAYDILYRDGEMLIDLPIEARRSRLEAALSTAAPPLMLSRQYSASTASELERLFEDARLRGNEGLLLKRLGSPYEPGKRSGEWHKLKRPFATLDVVITAAEQGTGRRATVLSDYTFGVRSENGFVNVGKAYSGLTDDEVRELTRILRASSLDRFGRVVLVKPQVVLEVAFDGVQKSARHKSGYALRFPRIVRWRKDKNAAQCDDLKRVRALYESSLNLTAPHE